MSEEEQNPVSEGENTQEAVVENQQSNGDVAQEEKMVPLKALQAEKRKRQDAEGQINWFKEQAVATQRQSPPQQEDDSEELLTKGELRKLSSAQQMHIKREVLEESFLASNPNALEKINTELEEILNKRPFLAQAIQASPNRYSAAWQIVQDYAPKSAGGNMTQKMKENEKKPGSPATVGRSGQLSSVESLAKMSKSEFKEYRQNMRAKG